MTLIFIFTGAVAWLFVALFAAIRLMEHMHDRFDEQLLPYEKPTMSTTLPDNVTPLLRHRRDISR